MTRLARLLQPYEHLFAVRRRPPPAPRVDIATGPSAPAWVFRLFVVGLLVASVALVTRHQGHWLAAFLLLVGVALRPDGGAPAMIAGGIGLLLVFGPNDPLHPRVFALIFLVHLAIEVGALIGPLPWDTRVEWRVVTRTAGGFLAIQAVAQTLALLGAVVAGQPPAMPWLPLLAAAALAVLAWTVSAQLRQRT